jgi:TPR repeat protein
MSEGDLQHVRCRHCRIAYWETEKRLALGGDFKCRCGAQSVHFTPFGDRQFDTLARIGNGTAATLAQRGVTAGLLAAAGVAIIAAGYYSFPYVGGAIQQGASLAVSTPLLPTLTSQQTRQISTQAADATRIVGSGAKIVLVNVTAAGSDAAQDFGTAARTVAPQVFAAETGTTQSSTTADHRPARTEEATAATLAEASEPASPLAAAIFSGTTGTVASSEPIAGPAPQGSIIETAAATADAPAVVLVRKGVAVGSPTPESLATANLPASRSAATTPPPLAEPPAPAKPLALGELYRPDFGSSDVTAISPATGGPSAADANDAATVAALRKAADLGDPMSQTLLSIALREGNGIARDDASALQLLTTAAQHGFATAQNLLGARYQLGDGVAADNGEAAAWYRMAATQGDPGAQYNLGALEAQGLGVPQDYADAYKWFVLAARNFSSTDLSNIAAAQSARDLAASHLSAGDLDRATTTITATEEIASPRTQTTAAPPA